MLEDYIVNVSLPISEDTAGGGPNFVLGSTFGYNEHEVPGEPIWYSDGQDIWLPPTNAMIFALFKGTVKFIPSGEDLGIGPESPRPEDTPFPAIGDTLVLQVWPQDFIKLKDLLPEGSQVPKYIIYQNVDSSSVLTRALSLIIDTPEYRDQYKKIFTAEEDGEEISDAEFSIRAETWINEEWLHGKGIGILVNSGNNLGQVATVPTLPAGISPEIRVNHQVPEGADIASWKRLTLKAVTDDNLYFANSFLFYLIKNVENPNWTTRPIFGEFIGQIVAWIESLPLLKVTHQLGTYWTYDNTPVADMPKALSDTVIKIKALNTNYQIATLYDPIHISEGYWRILSELPENGSGYQWHLNNSPLYAQRIPPSNRRDEVIDAITSADPGLIGLANENWLPFDTEGNITNDSSGQRMFILGMNMEACRRKNNHDLSGNDIVPNRRFRDEDRSGQMWRVYYENAKYETGWLDQPNTAGESMNNNSNRRSVESDFFNMRKMGVRAIRIWLSEHLEGIRFSFTTPDATGKSLLDREKLLADNDLNPYLKRIWIEKPPNGSNKGHRLFEYFCSHFEFQGLKSRIGLGSRSEMLNAVAPSSNLLFQRLLYNAKFLLQKAHENGMRIFWTLLTHYGERVLPVHVGWENIIYQASHVDYDPSLRSSHGGRLPLEAWIYRELIINPDFRQSYIDNFLIPFVNEIEQMPSSQGKTLGYEIINEADINWDYCNHVWSNHIKGGGPYPTHWKLGLNYLRSFINDCTINIQLVLDGYSKKRLIVSGVLASGPSADDWNLHTRVLQNELLVTNQIAETRPSSILPGDPPVPPLTNLQLTASAITRYTNGDGWRNHTWNIDRDSWIKGGYRGCLLVEAGDSWRGDYNCQIHHRTINDLLNTVFNQGFVGAFLWHYNDPARNSSNKLDKNAFTEQRYLDELHEHRTNGQPLNNVLQFRDANPRPGCVTLSRFSRQQTQLIIPFL